MGWLAAIVLILLLLLSTSFRILALVLIVALALYWMISSSNHEKEMAARRSRISQDLIDMQGVTFKRDTYFSSDYKLQGRLKNNSSKYSVRQIEITVTVMDCPPNGESSGCVTIGEKTESLYLEVPPTQARDFDERISFSGNELKPRGEFVWKYTVGTIEAD